MKATKTLGLMAVSCALAMGCAMPAFAVSVSETPDSGTNLNYADENNKATGDASTNVHVETSISQIDVTVPLNIVVAADANGGALTATPTAGVYGISNNSSVDVFVTAMESTAEDGWGFTSTAPRKGAAPETGTKADIYMTVQGGTWTDGADGAEGTFTANAKPTKATVITTEDIAVTPSDWKIGAESTLALQTAGATSVIKNVGLVGDNGDGTSAEKAFAVKYTISATTE